MDIRYWFLLFFIYAFIGWIVEVIYEYYQRKYLVNRGFLMGPYLPIDGFGCIVMIYFLTDYLESPIILFVMAIFICSVLEYSTSYIMEKIFKIRWWDYNDKKFNINGRICLETMIPFGIGALLILYFINPIIVKFLNSFSNQVITYSAIILFAIITIDFIISFKIIYSFRKINTFSLKDSTKEINERVRKILSNKSFLYKRLMEAFPILKANIKKITNIINKK